ncbi:MAG: phenylalanine--tRNA ligase subunit beta [Wenzhouxiangella sp.]
MKISYRWLKEWVALDLDAEQVAERFTLAGLEVDEVSPVAPPLDGVVVGEILTAEQHPDADRLRVCTVAGDEQVRTIVCGAPNARVGLKAPLATLGTVLPGGLKIKPAKLRGIRSEGMLCSEPELGLGEESGGLLELPADAPTGQSLSDYLGLDDQVLDIDLTPNRADCLSVRGLARELAALTGAALKPRSISPVEPVIEDRPSIRLESPVDCPRYLGRIVRGVNVNAATPGWMVEALRRSGIRSLGPVVDVTNYVLLELGQPMHAFDLATLEGAIVVRRAVKGEQLLLLDGREVALDADMLLIADERKPLALGGVMGGLPSAVSDSTQDILLESAWFDPRVIAGRARRLGLATESAHRFERGVDPALQREAMERATALILQIAGGQPGPIEESVSTSDLPVQATVRLRLARLNGLLGAELDAATVEDILLGLGMSLERDGDDFLVQAPSARRDIAIEVDLIEEVARVYGYDRLPARRPGGGLSIEVGSERQLPEQTLRTQLIARGFQEILTWSFVAEDWLDQLGLKAGAQPLANPLSRDMAVLRTSLLPGLLETAGSNLRRQHPDFRLFETGVCFQQLEDGFAETRRLGLLMTGLAEGEHFSARPRALDFFDLKGEIEHLLELNACEGEFAFERSSHPWLHPGQGANLLCDGRPVGWLGQLHPTLQDQLDWPQTAFIAEIDLAALLRRRLPQSVPSSRYPQVRRDLSFVVADDVPASEILALVQASGGELLHRAAIFDEYRGQGVEADCRSLSISLILRHISRTLGDKEIEDTVQAVLESLQSRYNVKMRG